MAFNSQEIDLLLDALDIFESTTKGNNSMLNMVASSMVSSSEMRDRYLDKQNKEATLTRERIILLKAKLVRMKDKTFIDDLTGE